MMFRLKPAATLRNELHGFISGMLALGLTACTTAQIPNIPAQSERGQLVSLTVLTDTHDIALPERFQGRWLDTSIRCRPDRAQPETLLLKRSRLSKGDSGKDELYQDIRGYPDYGDAIEISVADAEGKLRLLFLQISPDAQLLRITQGGEAAVNGVVRKTVKTLRSCPIGG